MNEKERYVYVLKYGSVPKTQLQEEPTKHKPNPNKDDKIAPSQDLQQIIRNKIIHDNSTKDIIFNILKITYLRKIKRND